jgi:hypothetical protein
MYVGGRACVSERVCMYMCIYICVCIYVYVCMCVCVCVCARVCVHVCVCMCVCVSEIKSASEAEEIGEWYACLCVYIAEFNVELGLPILG